MSMKGLIGSQVMLPWSTQCHLHASFPNNSVAIGYLACHPPFVTSGFYYFVFRTHYYGCTVLNRLARYVIQDSTLLPWPYPLPTITHLIFKVEQVLIPSLWCCLVDKHAYHGASNEKPIINSTLRSKQTKQELIKETSKVDWGRNMWITAWNR